VASFSGVPRSDLKVEQVSSASLDLKGQKVAVVGGTGGIGRALARVLSGRGAQVTVVGQTFRDQGAPGLSFLKADLNLMREARRVARELPAEELDLLVFTTGIMAATKREETAEGIERDLAVSYLSRLAMVRELGPRLGKARPATARKPRVFVMGFPGTGQKANTEDLNSEKVYQAMATHMYTVAGNEALVLDSVGRYPNANFFGLNPGLIKSNIRSNFLGGEGSFKHRLVEGLIGLVMISAERYAERIAPVLVAPQLEQHSGAMFNQKGSAILASPELNPTEVSALIAASERLLGRTNDAAAAA
jgi:NAD(P)-dependent dehydrogenase (short-subunit alcohol dehydrogenase family)